MSSWNIITTQFIPLPEPQTTENRYWLTELKPTGFPFFLEKLAPRKIVDGSLAYSDSRTYMIVLLCQVTSRSRLQTYSRLIYVLPCSEVEERISKILHTGRQINNSTNKDYDATAKPESPVSRKREWPVLYRTGEPSDTEQENDPQRGGRMEGEGDMSPGYPTGNHVTWSRAER